MAGPSKRRPAAKPTGALIGIRLPASLLEALDEARGETERSTWVRAVIEDRLVTHELRAFYEVLEFAGRRGISAGRLAELLGALED